MEVGFELGDDEKYPCLLFTYVCDRRNHWPHGVHAFFLFIKFEMDFFDITIAASETEIADEQVPILVFAWENTGELISIPSIRDGCSHFRVKLVIGLSRSGESSLVPMFHKIPNMQIPPWRDWSVYMPRHVNVSRNRSGRSSHRRSDL